MSIIDQLPSKKLSLKEEQRLARRIRARGRTCDINKLVMANILEAFVYARRCCREAIPDDALLSYCYTALRKNAKRFRPGFRIRFFAYCKVGLRGEITNYWRTLELVRHVPTSEVISDEIETDEKEVVDPDFDVIYNNERWLAMEKVIEFACSKQEQVILSLSYQGELNFQEIGLLLKVSRSAIQAIHARALKNIRDAIVENPGLFPCENISPGFWHENRRSA
jgi:RNA polymerase sigma factor (sigma-70 family)